MKNAYIRAIDAVLTPNGRTRPENAVLDGLDYAAQANDAYDEMAAVRQSPDTEMGEFARKQQRFQDLSAKAGGCIGYESLGTKAHKVNRLVGEPDFLGLYTESTW